MSANVYSQGFGSTSLSALGIIPIVTVREPGATDIRGPAGPFRIGQEWIDSSANVVYVLTSLTSSAGNVTANWTATQSAGTLLTLTGDSGGAISPDGGGNITLAGTAGEITTTGSGNTITFTLPSTMVVPGSLEVTGFFQADAGATMNTAGTAINIATDTDTAAVNIGNGTTTRTISVGTTSGVKTIHIGDGVSGNTVTIENGTNTSAQTLNIASGASGANSTVSILNGAATTGAQVFNLLSGVTGPTSATVNILDGAATGGTLAFNLFGAGATTTAGTVNINTGAAAHVLNMGSSSAGNITSTIASGSTYAVVGSGGTIDLGNDAAANTINLGSTSGGTLTVAMGTAMNFQGAVGCTITIGASAQTGLITIGSTSSTGGVTIGGSTGAQTLNFGTGGTGVKTIHIGDGAAANVLTIGSTTAGATLALQSATSTHIFGAVGATITIGAAAQTGQISIADSTAAMPAVDLMNGVAAGAQVLNIASGTSASAAQTVNLLNGITPGASTTLNIMNGAASAGTQTVNMLATGATRAGAINIGTGAAAHILTIGSTSGAAALTLQAGSGNINMTGLVVSANSIEINGAGTFLGVHHGAVTDFVGTCTLSSGVIQVNNTNIATGDIILLTRVSINGSAVLGELTYTISNAASFTVTSVILATPGSTQTADNSILAYMIVRPV